MERTEKTVGFVDIAGYMSAFKEADSATEALQSFYKSAGDTIYAHGGRIVKYIGDSILFTFDNPKQAVEAAQELAAVRVNGCHVYTSLATGVIYQGKVGHPNFQTDDILGTTVNTAGQLLRQARNNSDHLALDEATRTKAQV